MKACYIKNLHRTPLSSLKFISLAYLTVVLLASCKKDYEPQLNSSADKNIAANIAASADFSIMDEAIKKAGLQEMLEGTEDLTLFAPSNSAFETYFYQIGAEGLSDIAEEDLRSLLLNHLVTGKLMTSAMSKGYINSLNRSAPGNNATTLYISNTDPFIIDGSRKITIPDIACNNGIIHGIDKVIRPESLIDHIINNPDFSMLIQLVLSSGMSDTLVSDGPFTILAPSNAVFQAAMDSMGITTLDPSLLQQLAPLALYHVVQGNYPVNDLPQGSLESMLTGFNLIFDKSSEQVLINNTVKITTPDIQATNGVIHIVDGFCIPVQKK